MADSKITALTALTAADPANDMIPIVDVSDTPPASGNTKRISINNILACSPSATLASATISGDLTVDTSTLKVDSTNNRVGIGTASPAAPVDVQGSSLRLQLQSSSNGGYATWKYIGKNSSGTAVNFEQGLNIAADNAFELYDNQNTQLVSRYVSGVSGAHSWFLTGSTAMTLNSTGLGVGGSPTASKFEVYSSNTGTSGLAEANALKVENNNATVGNASGLFLSQSGNAGCGVAAVATSRTGGSRASDLALYYYNQSTSSSPIEGLRLNSSGNVGIGVTPSATNSTYYQALEIGRVGQGLTGAKNALTSSPNSWLSNNSYATYSAGIVWKYAVSQPAAQYRLLDASHQWYRSTDVTPTAGNAITFTQAMTLNAAGSLVLGAAAVATTATDGFLYIPGCAGTPTGTPTAQTGRVPLVVDTTNNKLYFYSGGSWVAAN
jgi:hypothetical protein